MQNNRRMMAIEYFKKGYNCSQSIILAFEDLYINDLETILKCSVPFGGGYSRMRETCGAVSAITLIIGKLFGYTTPETGEKKIELYSITQKLLKEFENRFGSLTCRALLNLSNNHDEPIPSKRTKEFYLKRPCAELIGGAAEILDNYLKSINYYDKKK